MQKFPRDRAILAAAVAMTVAIGCRPASFVGGALRNHPPELVGEWVDSAKSTAADTSLWLLDASGNDESRHMMLDTAGHGGSYLATPPKRYGYWYFQGTLADPADRAICFTKRPSRSAPTCLPFDLDSTTTSAGVRRRLVVRGYQGAHTTLDRVLLARLK